MTAYAMKYELKLSNNSQINEISIDIPQEFQLLTSVKDSHDSPEYEIQTDIYTKDDTEPENFIIIQKETWPDVTIYKFNYPYIQKGNSVTFDF
ncbi:hypothetical protein [Aerococcus kribbianus]|uniref:Uncharacterized protein n=1 Tax=Aerococcus kribbianus TaxID=2999064 RepID=A0A9X3FQ04_9LACT|nr:MULTISPECIES: hypothetical protein [unclassified Aerococcus]MCZ0717864.1 hypothetical protein [Aerococcus sp. YH-aer221]MCZ0726151.1 hypothetical protein [Aerococcus sp. YH-aer222]